MEGKSHSNDPSSPASQDRFGAGEMSAAVAMRGGQGTTTRDSMLSRGASSDDDNRKRKRQGDDESARESQPRQPRNNGSIPATMILPNGNGKLCRAFSESSTSRALQSAC